MKNIFILILIVLNALAICITDVLSAKVSGVIGIIILAISLALNK